MKFISYIALLFLSDTSAIRTQSASALVEQARNMVDVDSEAYTHLTNALYGLPSMGAPAAGPTAAKSSVLDTHSQLVHIPIDEKRDLTLKVSPTYELDNVNSVTLKSFRKIVGYDTFESIRKKGRNESKDICDYYNVTVSMMI